MDNLIALRFFDGSCFPCTIAKFQSIQETGAKFANTISSRTIIGHDANGVVKIIQFDGVSWETGYVVVRCSICYIIPSIKFTYCRLDIWLLADVLAKDYKLMNAINLDGGSLQMA